MALRRALMLGVSVALASPTFGAGNSTTRAAFPAFQWPRMPMAANAKQSLGLVAAKPGTQMPSAFLPPQTTAEYTIMLQRLIAWKRWKMAYYYLYSTRYSAFVSVMPCDEELSTEAANLKIWLQKAAVFFDVLANYEISGFIGLVLLQTWAAPMPTDMAGAISYYQNIKLVYSFWTWQYYLILKDYMTLFPEAYTWVDDKVKMYFEIAETYACWYAFNEYHVSKMMTAAAIKDSTSDLGKATLASFFWDETFIKTVKTLMGYKMWGWQYPEAKWLKTTSPFIALSLPWIAFIQSYWESTIATVMEGKSAKAASK